MILCFNDLSVTGASVFAKGKNLSNTILSNESGTGICVKLPYCDNPNAFNPSAADKFNVYVSSTSAALEEGEGIQLRMYVSMFNVELQSFDENSRVSFTLTEDKKTLEKSYSEIEFYWFEDYENQVDKVAKDLKIGKILYVVIKPTK